MKKSIKLILILICTSCSQEVEIRSFEEMYSMKPELYDDGGILTETKDTSLLAFGDYYTEDNVIYIPNRTFLYRYKFSNKNGEEYRIRLKDKMDDYGNRRLFWDYSQESGDSIIAFLRIIPESRNNTFESDYNQTVIKMEYLDEEKETLGGWEKTGVIENHGNIWIHPFRQYFFKILELNPFPHIKNPIEVGNKWFWELSVGDFWSDERWKKWEGIVKIKFEYEIIGLENIKIDNSRLECWIIEGKGTSELGNTRLRSYFNQTEGFVKMEYVNIDGSKLILEKINERQ